MMNCNVFESLDFSFPIKKSDEVLYIEYVNHMQQCNNCADFYLRRTIERRGFNPLDFCCPTMGEKLTFVCDKHPFANPCEDYVVIKKSDGEIGINSHKGAFYKIEYCPWCGCDLSKY